MIETVWPYVAVMLLSAGLFPSLEKRYGWRLFSVLPPIVLTYLFVTALAVAGAVAGDARDRSGAAHAHAHSCCRRCCSC